MREVGGINWGEMSGRDTYQATGSWAWPVALAAGRIGWPQTGTRLVGVKKLEWEYLRGNIFKLSSSFENIEDTAISRTTTRTVGPPTYQLYTTLWED